MSRASVITLGRLGFYILAPFIFILVPSSFFESGHSICLVKNVLGVECFGCGMTRAISYFFHGDLFRAFQCNKAVMLVFPLLCYIFLQQLWSEYRKYYIAKTECDHKTKIESWWIKGIIRGEKDKPSESAKDLNKCLNL